MPIVVLADVYPHLNMAGPPPDGGVELQGFIDAATPVIEDICGRVAQVTITGELHDGGDISINLRQPPVISVTTVTEVIGMTSYTLTSQPVGSPVDNFGYSLDSKSSGRITRRGAGSTPVRFYPNTANISVTYVAGLAAVPANVRLATLELIRHMYQWGQQGNRPAFGAPVDDMVATPSGYLVPNRVKALCKPNERPEVFA